MGLGPGWGSSPDTASGFPTIQTWHVPIYQYNVVGRRLWLLQVLQRGLATGDAGARPTQREHDTPQYVARQRVVVNDQYALGRHP